MAVSCFFWSPWFSSSDRDGAGFEVSLRGRDGAGFGVRGSGFGFRGSRHEIIRASRPDKADEGIVRGCRFVLRFFVVAFFSLSEREKRKENEKKERKEEREKQGEGEKEGRKGRRKRKERKGKERENKEER